MKKLSFASALYLVALLAFLWGSLAMRYRVFPGEQLARVYEELDVFVAGHPDEPRTSPLEKAISDMGGVPYRYVQEAGDSLATPDQAVPFEIEEHGVHLKGYYRPGRIPDGYILLFGAFDFPGRSNAGTVLIDTRGELKGVWAYPHRTISVNPVVDVERKLIFPSGKYFIPWGCDIGNVDRPVETTTFGEKGHHGIHRAPDGSYWTLRDWSIVQLKPSEGPDYQPFESGTTIYIPNIAASNDAISPLTTRRLMSWDTDRDPQKLDPSFAWLEDPFHTNDLEPFVHPRFESEFGYTLLVSIRSQNLILVLDPATEEILWFRQGLVERQHDPDVYGDGMFVFNNRSFGSHSSLDYIPFEATDDLTLGKTTFIDGEPYGWFDPSRGQHSVFDARGGRWHLVTNDRGGRLLLFDEDGELVFESVSYLSGSDYEVLLQVRSSLFIKPAEYEALMGGCDRGSGSTGPDDR